MRPAFCALIVCLLLTVICQAQTSDLQADAASIAQDGVIRGLLDDDNPRDVYFLDGLRGEVIGLALSAVSGDLDPVLSVFDETGALALRQDDSAGGLDAASDLVMARTGRYFVIVGRYGYQLGSSAGEYLLQLTRKGVLSERGSALRYGDSVIGTISDSNSRGLLHLSGAAGRHTDHFHAALLRHAGPLLASRRQRALRYRAE